MMPENARLILALKACVDLIEDWAYGSIFESAGIRWPDGVCSAPALVKAKRLLEDKELIWRARAEAFGQSTQNLLDKQGVFRMPYECPKCGASGTQPGPCSVCGSEKEPA